MDESNSNNNNNESESNTTVLIFDEWQNWSRKCSKNVIIKIGRNI